MRRSNSAAAYLAFALAAGASLGSAQPGPVAGHRQYPQFRNASGLPGSLHGITSEGEVRFGGAMAISTPLGYGFAKGQNVVGFCILSDCATFQLSGNFKEGLLGANVTGYLLSGVALPAGRLTVGGMLLSAQGDTVLNVAWQAPLPSKRLGISIGAQDLTSSGGSAGQNRATDGDISRSLYVVATYALAEGAYVSLGKGERRLKGVFGSASMALSQRMAAAVEYDAFGWNALVAYDLGTVGGILPGRRSDLTLSVGLVRGKNAFLALSSSF